VVRGRGELSNGYFKTLKLKRETRLEERKTNFKVREIGSRRCQSSVLYGVFYCGREKKPEWGV